MNTIKGGVKMPQYVSGDIRLQSGRVTPAVGRIINVFPDENHDAFSFITVEGVTADIDPNIIPGNIRKNINILGCIGDLGGEYQEKSVTPSGSQQTITPDSGYYALSKVTVRPTAMAHLTAFPQTSDRDVVPGTGFSGLSALTLEPVTAAIDDDIKPENIKEGVTVLGVTGTLKGSGNELSKSYHPSSLTAANIKNALNSVVIPSGITSIGNSAFENINIQHVILPDSLTAIGQKAFYSSTYLMSMRFPDSLRTIGAQAFKQCSHMSDVYLPDSVTSVGAQAFMQVSYLSDVSLSAGMTEISSETFRASGLKRIYIPASVTSVGLNAFAYCNSLTDVYYGGTQEQWNAVTINNDQSGNAKLHAAQKHFNSTGLPDN